MFHVSIRLLKAAPCLLSVFFLLGCQTSPTGRKQLAIVPDAQMQQMGNQAFEEMKQKQKVNQDPAVNSYVRCVASKITSQLSDQQYWNVVVFDEDSPNAFALPGGNIGVHSGLLKVAKSPSQLATVLGHEVAHVTANHGEERVSQQLAAQGGLTVLSAILGNPNDQRKSLLMAAIGIGAQYGILMPYSRKQESEADIVGLDFMAQAGFDPRESVALWENMAAAGGAQPPEFLSTHPSHGSRIDTLQENMPGAMEAFQKVSKKPDCQPPQ